MGPPDRFQMLWHWDYWILPAALTVALSPGHISSVGVFIGPLQLCVNWGPYMRVCDA